jgi:photosystem II PsbU protein
LKFPGFYPNLAGKIVTNGPYKTVGDLSNIPGLSSAEKDLLKKNESKFVAKEPAADYVIDIFNNGLYR